jgi:hypothetical protein
MKTLRIVTFLILYVIITFFWLLYDRRNAFDKHTIGEVFQLPAIWVFPILMILIGLLLGRLYLFFKETKQRHFMFGQLTCITIAFLLFTNTFISDREHEKQFGNFDYNRANRDNTFFPADSSYQIKAYDALESNFQDKNSFRITDLFSDNVDTVINSVPTKIHISWFEYYLSSKPSEILCAKYYVFNDTLINAYINEEAKINFDFKRRKAYQDSLLKVIDSLSD